MPLLESASFSARPKPQRRNSAEGRGPKAGGSRFRRVFGFRPPASGRMRLLRVFGHSMSPVLNPGELVVVREGEFEDRPPRKGEIVAARPAALGGQAFVKRVAGLPSERVTVDGKAWQLSDDEFFLLGDHTEHSLDSRVFGLVTREELIGPVQARLWPWTVFESQPPPV